MMITDLDLILSKISQISYLSFILKFDHSQIVIFSAILLLLIFLLKNLYLLLILYFQGKLIMNLRVKISSDIFSYYILMSYEELINKNPAILIRTIESDIGNTFTYIQSFFTIIRESLILMSIFVLLFVTNFFISSISILTLGIPLIVFYYTYRNALKVKGKLFLLEAGKKLKLINQALASFKELKISNREKFFLRSFNFINLGLEKLGLFNYLITSIPRLFLEVTALLSVVVVSVLLYLVEDNTYSIIPLISLLAVTAVRLIPSLNAITTSLTTLRFRKPSFELIVHEIKKLKENKNSEIKEKLIVENKKTFNFKDELIIKDVHFKYLDANKAVLENLDLKIKKGSKVGIIGRSGAGKSTLVDLILGLLKPQKGQIYVDENKLHEVVNSWQGQIGYIPQEIYLLDDSIKNNIAFGIEKENINDELINNVVKVAQLEELVLSLPNKLETVIGNRAVKLSGGEKQRIAIARAVYNNPEILILDEATSALDIDNENKILDEINRNLSDKTIIIISHRNNTVKNCDIIYVMEDGKIIDNGKFQDVMKRNSFLKETS
jgi:ABC-type multidrug transport system fused ATPase/permease subunit